jgi:hypothetical protein
MTEPLTKGRLAHLLRVAVCLMSFGFIFPYALMENIDAVRLAAKEQLDASEASDKSR